jgi:hypothetical protein
MRNLTNLFFLAGIGIVTNTFAIAVVPISFGGDATLGNIQVTNTDTSVAGSLTPPTLTPETDVPTANNLSDGFSVTGRFDFINGTGASAELTFTASRPVSLSSNALATSASEDGFFGIDSTDTGLINSNSLISAVQGNLDSFTTTTQIQSTDATPIVLSGSVSSATDSGKTIPLTFTEFPTNSVESTAGPNFTSPFFGSGSFVLFQTVDIKISGLIPGEAIDIDLPTTSTVDVPEPASAGLLLGILVITTGRKFRR